MTAPWRSRSERCVDTPDPLRRERNPWSPGSGPHRVTGPDQYLNHMPVPCGIVGFDQTVDLFFKEPGQRSILRSQVTSAHDPSGSPPQTVKDEQAPAAVVPADLRSRQVDGAVSFRSRRIIPEKRARLRSLGEDACIGKQGDLIRINRHLCRFTRVLVADQVAVIPIIDMDRMDQAQVTAAFAALAAFKCQGTTFLITVSR